jgi:hypothetical protein
MVEVKLGSADNGRTAMTELTVGDPDLRTVVDRRGRKLVVRRPELLAEFHFTEAAGKEAAENTTWMGMAMPLIYLETIDGVPKTLLRNKLTIDALIKELDRDGYSALMAAIQEIVKDDNEMEPLKVKNS